MAHEARVRIVYDPKLKRPGCVLLQAALGGLDNERLILLFDSASWLVYPTPDMAVFDVTEEQLQLLSTMSAGPRSRGRR